MKTFKQILYYLLFISFIFTFISSLFSNIAFFKFVFGISILIMILTPLVLAVVEIGSGDIPNPYENNDYYLD